MLILRKYPTMQDKNLKEGLSIEDILPVRKKIKKVSFTGIWRVQIGTKPGQVLFIINFIQVAY
jgi:hypothetical protein